MAGTPKKRARRDLQAKLSMPVQTDTGGEASRAHAPASGRYCPPQLSPSQVDGMLRALSSGCTFDAACASESVNRSTAYTLMRIDERFKALIDDARDGWSRQHVDYIAQTEDWRARSWLLERRMPKEYAVTNKVAGHDGGALLADAELLELARRALGVVPPDGDAGED